MHWKLSIENTCIREHFCHVKYHEILLTLSSLEAWLRIRIDLMRARIQYFQKFIYPVMGKAVNREDKRSRRYRGRDFGISGKSRRYRDR